MNFQSVRPGDRVVVVALYTTHGWHVQSDFLEGRRIGMVGSVQSKIASRESLFWITDEKTGRIFAYSAEEFDPAPKMEKPTHGPIDNCPCCGGKPTLFSGYDERSGWGDKNKGWLSCRCGLSMGAPTISVPGATMEITALILKWNTRVAVAPKRPEPVLPLENVVLPRPIQGRDDDDGAW